MYHYREKFHHILDNADSVENAVLSINEWVDKIQKGCITQFDGFIKTLAHTKEYVANYVRNYLSNAVTEGLNNLIRSVRRIAFGMGNFEHLRL